MDLHVGPMVVIAAPSLTLLSISCSLLLVRVQRACAIVGAVRMRCALETCCDVHGACSTVTPGGGNRGILEGDTRYDRGVHNDTREVIEARSRR